MGVHVIAIVVSFHDFVVDVIVVIFDDFVLRVIVVSFDDFVVDLCSKLISNAFRLHSIVVVVHYLTSFHYSI
jgi:hypothetical protein